MSDWDRQTAPGGAEGPQWVSAAEAADVAGVTPGTVRYWARNGLIVSEVVEGAAGERTLVRLDEVLQHARQEGPGRPPPASGPTGGRHSAPSEVVTDLPARTSELAPILKSIPEIMAQLTAATDRAARAETKVEFLSAQLVDLRRRLAEAEAGRDGGGPAVAIPEAWESVASEEPSIGEDARAIVVEDEPADVPGATG
ncbi:MAG TPA: MerR family transcriptional regulator, partial [Actinomycetota bacterium]|nr:MerR family transcriptional regulator [Actinomycetota bacterium]